MIYSIGKTLKKWVEYEKNYFNIIFNVNSILFCFYRLWNNTFGKTNNKLYISTTLSVFKKAMCDFKHSNTTKYLSGKLGRTVGTARF